MPAGRLSSRGSSNLRMISFIVTYTIEEAERAAGLGKEGKRPTSVAIAPPSHVLEDITM